MPVAPLIRSTATRLSAHKGDRPYDARCHAYIDRPKRHLQNGGYLRMKQVCNSKQIYEELLASVYNDYIDISSDFTINKISIEKDVSNLENSMQSLGLHGSIISVRICVNFAMFEYSPSKPLDITIIQNYANFIASCMSVPYIKIYAIPGIWIEFPRNYPLIPCKERPFLD